MVRGYFYATSSIEDTNAVGGFGRSGNNSIKFTADFNHASNGLSLIIDTSVLGEFNESIAAYRVYLVNGTDSTIGFRASDSRLPIVAEAYDKGKWKPIEYLPSSWCGNSYHTIFLPAEEYWRFNVPAYDGKYQTRIRYRLRLNNGKFLYSNEIKASINKSQFSKKEGYTPQGLMDPYLN